jgi:hypothetical protein
VSASPALQAQVRARGGYARRYDPIRSTVEHDALRRRKVNLAGEAANLKVAHPDLCAELKPSSFNGLRARSPTICPRRDRRCSPDQKPRHGRIFVRLLARVRDAGDNTEGPAHAGSPHGSSATAEQQAAHYVIEQQNEAIYIQLNAGMVAAFLQRNGVLAQPPTLPRTIGGSLIESYQDFGLF